MIKSLSLAAVAVAVLASVALLVPRSAAGQDEEGFKNLQVLPADIGRDDLRTLMQAQARSLGVRCTHCHVRGDFPSDENPNKLLARQMMQMTRTFGADHLQGRDLGCGNCHGGELEPAADAEIRAAFSALDPATVAGVLSATLTDEDLARRTRAWLGLEGGDDGETAAAE